jgi:NitT/TauT family transport system substrate-binding protein
MLAKFMDPKDVVTVELPPNTQLQALDSGQVDALLTYDEIAVTALQNNIAQPLEENPLCKYVIDPLYAFPYVFSSKFVRENPQAARKFRDAMYKASDFIRTNANEARQIMAKWGGAKPEVANNVKLWAQVKAEDVDKAAVQNLADIFFTGGVTKKKIDTSHLYLTEADLK